MEFKDPSKDAAPQSVARIYSPPERDSLEMKRMPAA